jgi:hypothetical protein
MGRGLQKTDRQNRRPDSILIAFSSTVTRTETKKRHTTKMQYKSSTAYIVFHVHIARK